MNAEYRKGIFHLLRQSSKDSLKIFSAVDFSKADFPSTMSQDFPRLESFEFIECPLDFINHLPEFDALGTLKINNNHHNMGMLEAVEPPSKQLDLWKLRSLEMHLPDGYVLPQSHTQFKINLLTVRQLELYDSSSKADEKQIDTFFNSLTSVSYRLTHAYFYRKCSEPMNFVDLHNYLNTKGLINTFGVVKLRYTPQLFRDICTLTYLKKIRLDTAAWEPKQRIAFKENIYDNNKALCYNVKGYIFEVFFLRKEHNFPTIVIHD